MIRVQFLLAACVAMTVLTQDGIQEGVISLMTSPTQVIPKSSQTGSQSENSEQIDPAQEQRIQAEIADIMAIRQQLGGGVSEQLKGLSIEMPAGKKDEPQVPNEKKKVNFDEAFVRQLVKQTRNSAKQSQKSAMQTQNPVAAQAGNWSVETIAKKNPAAFAQERAMPPHERRETVRHAARMLEEAAAILEEASEYDQADKVRQTAGELWRTARQR